jgi:polyhydroxyalkanoate synthase
VTGVHLDQEERLTLTVDGEERLEVVRQHLRIPAEGGEPPLAVERTVRAEGASRPPVILVHGFAQNRYTWRISDRAFCGHLASQGFEVLNLELRGHGRSRAMGAGNARAFSEYVLDARRVVERCRARPFLIGHSLGGAVGVGVATEVPLAGLVQLAGVYRFARHNRTLRALARATLLCEPLLLAAPVRVRTGWAGELIAKMYAVTDIAGYGAPIAGWAPDSIERELLAERLAQGFDWTSAEVWLQMSRWATGEPFAWAEAFEGLDLPLLVIAGDSDPLVKVEDARLCWERSRSTDKELLVFDMFEHEVHWGHVDLVLGRRAPRIVWPRISAWMLERCG